MSPALFDALMAPCTCPTTTRVHRDTNMRSTFTTERTGYDPDCQVHADDCECSTELVQEDDRLPRLLRFRNPTCPVHTEERE